MGERTEIRNAALSGEGGPRVTITIEDGLITAVGPVAEPVGEPDSAARLAPGNAPDVIDATGLLASPGFIELQINGAAGADLTADPGSIWDVGAALAPYGVTAFLPTLVTTTREVIERAQAVLLGGPPAGYAGARPLGLHVEGPFLAPARRGAHDPALLRDPDAAFIDGWSPSTGIRLVTIAPELPGAFGLIEALVGRGVVVAIGHTDATRAQSFAAFEAGASAVTHLYNAMPKAIDTGPVAAALADPRVTVGLIADGLHVDPSAVAAAWRAAGPDHVSLVTDAIAALGMPPGRFPLGSMECTVDGSSARLDDGRLAGSLLTLDLAVRNLRDFAGATTDEAIATVTSTPADLLGEGARLGRLAPGAAGDVTLLSADLTVAATIIGGRVAYQNGVAL